MKNEPAYFETPIQVKARYSVRGTDAFLDADKTYTAVGTITAFNRPHYIIQMGRDEIAWGFDRFYERGTQTTGRSYGQRNVYSKEKTHGNNTSVQPRFKISLRGSAERT